MTKIPKKYRDKFEESVVVRKKRKTGELVYGPKGKRAKQIAQTERRLSRPKLTQYIKSRLAAKIKKVKKDNPSLTHEQAVGKAIGILRHKEKKKG